MKCSACGYLEMVVKTLDETLSYGGRSLVLNSMPGKFCPNCGRGGWDEQSYGRYIEAQTDLLCAANGDMSFEIRRIRKNLKDSQEEAGKVAFSRNECGKTRPTGPYCQGSQNCAAAPDLLNEMRNAGHSLA